MTTLYLSIIYKANKHKEIENKTNKQTTNSLLKNTSDC